MRYLLYILLFSTTPIFSQNSELKSIDTDAKQVILTNKWYLNAVIINEFGWNDTSALVTSVPSKTFIRFGEKMEFGRDRASSDTANNTFKYFRLYMEDSISGDIRIYQNKKEYRKDDNPTYYNIQFNGHQLTLITNEPTIDPLKDLGGTRRYIFSRTIDSDQLTTGILGRWKMDSVQNLLLIGKGKEVTLQKTISSSINSLDDSYYFGLFDGDMVCSSNCFRLPIIEENRHVRSRRVAVAPDPHYTSHRSYTPLTFAIDIEQRLLVFFNNNERIEFEISGLTNNQLFLKKR